MVELGWRRRFETRYFKARRVQAEAKSLQSAVLSASVHRLKKNQQAAVVLGDNFS
jgi:hypothetical protein